MTRSSRDMLSVGIDVGTTTTQIVFSNLSIQDTARLGQAPRIQVNARAIVYQSPIHFTPLISADEVDVERLSALVRGEYRAAGVQPGQIETGAVIITGEAARARNADAILAALSGLAGEFVVTVAGPNVEAQIAGRGSGAAAYSVDHYTQVTNIDIGGGTANAAIFRLGEHLSSSAMAVGGRQIEVERSSGIVRHIAPPGRRIVATLNLPLREGGRADLEALRRFCEAMADLIADLATGRETELGRNVQLTPPLRGAEASSVVFFSGGIGAYFYDPVEITSLSEVAIHDDVGPLLAQSLRLNRRLQQLAVRRPPQTLRATVLGAASQTVTLSGSTIWAEQELLPLRNLPVVRPHLTEADLKPDRLAESIRYAVRRWDVDPSQGKVAIALDLPVHLDYTLLQAIAGGVITYAATDLHPGQPMVLIIERDYAQSLGQTIKALRPDLPLLAIDQVGLGEGDFIDIGLPMLDGRVVPLSVKTLIFYR
ncbi:MAG: ethanolamine ammonia-lyase reactivating factor EutA [Caldilineales bacterium]|nr:ethanolamine ammonia-lyase reactivating factor EutA [Caldilineales bacterium]